MTARSATTRLPRDALIALVPVLTARWAHDVGEDHWQTRQGSMVFADISGFSKLSEDLGRLGPAGTEELADLINASFESLIGAAAAYGGDALKIMGDGLLVWFEGPDHARRAATACHEMHGALVRPLHTSAQRPVRLRMSAGASSGEFLFMMTSGRHRELVVCGPATSAVMALEKVATPGQTAVGRPMAALLPPSWRGPRRGDGRLLRGRATAVAGASLPTLPRRLADLATHVPVTQLELLRVRAPGEHRQCAISFVSIAGTDDVVATDGPAGLHRLVTSVTDVVDAATERWGTQFLSSDTGSNAVGLMLTGGVPTSSGNDEDRLLRTVLEVVERCPHVDLRIGVNRGRIYSGFVGSARRRGFTAMGDAVNLSARLMQRAEPRQIIATRAVLDASESTFDEQPLEPFTVKNRVAPVEASIVVAVVDRDHRGVTHDLPFVGRQHELAELGAIADAAVAGGGAILAIRGDAGVGKSRLVVEFERRRPDLVAAHLAADEYTASLAYSLTRSLIVRLAGLDATAAPAALGTALGDWLRRVAPAELAWLPLLAAIFEADVPPTRQVDDLADEFRKGRLHQAAAAAIDGALDGTSLVVVDDAQWIDEASTEVIGALTTQPRLLVLLIGGDVVPPWAAGAIGMRLAQLPDHDAGQLAIAAAAGRLSRRDLIRVAERAGGNPLFLTNLVDAVLASGEVDTLPSTIESLVTRRIDDLDGRDRVLLREAAVAGMEFDLTTLGRVLDSRRVAGAGVWRRLAPFVGRSEPGRMRFLHGMYQRVAYEGLSFRRRRELHLALGRELEEAGAEPAVLSLHFWRAERHDRAFHWSVEAASRAQRTYANVEAAELYRRALTSAARLTPAPPRRAELAEALGDVLELSADYDAARHAYDEARRNGGDADPQTAARLLRKIGVLREHVGAYTDALRWYARAIRRLHADGTTTAPADLAELELAYGGVRFRQGSHADARRRARAAIDLVIAANDDRVLGHAYSLLTVIDVALGDSWPPSAGLALATLERHGDLVRQSDLYNNLGVAAYFAGDWDAALANYERSRDLGGRTGDAVLEATLANNIGEIMSDRGQLTAAVELFESALETFRAARYRLGVAFVMGNLGRAELRRGDTSRAREKLEEARREFEDSGAATYVADMLVRHAESAIADGRAAEALADLAEAEERFRVAPDGQLVVTLRRVRADALLVADRLDDAVAVATDAVDRARAVGATFEEAQALITRATARRRSSDAAEADSDEAAATELLATLGISRAASL